MPLSWEPPHNHHQRPIAILGGGVLGRRIGAVWVSAGYDVHIRDPSSQQRLDALAYIKDNAASYAQQTGKPLGKAQVFESLEDTVKDSWLVIEAVPERIQIKIDTFKELEELAPADAILATNSSSYKSSEMLEKVSEKTKTRILNMHYYMPPECMVVELMTDGHTSEEIFPFMVRECLEAATVPYVARKESTGFIFNRLWAAVKREILTILHDGVSDPAEIDSIWNEMFIKGRSLPCHMMDSVGLDTVAFIESHYIKERGLSSEKTVDFLQKNYLDQGKLGNKSTKGGLYPPRDPNQTRILALDTGLSLAETSLTSGEIIELTTDGSVRRVLVRNQALPDGLIVVNERMYWTCMGTPGVNDGALYSANLDGLDIQTIISPGTINTPKQLTADESAKKIYFSDREGLRVYRCNLDGTELEIIVQTGNWEVREDMHDSMKWCVGITVAPKFGKFYWSQKGPSKASQGRIFCANISTPAGQSGKSRDDIQCIFSGLPEAIDLEVDEVSRKLYWTDRGEVPLGNSLYKANLDESGLPPSGPTSKNFEIIAKNLNEAIGLKLDLNNSQVYFTDLGGSIYRCDVDGKHKEKLYSDESRAFTGITIV
ncbi:hypothetical protein B7463_g11894, partial [Scytalidium lignicola]